MPENMKKVQILRESFIPATIVMALLFLAVFFVEIKVKMDAEKVVVVEIESSAGTTAVILEEDPDDELRVVAASGGGVDQPAAGPLKALAVAQTRSSAPMASAAGSNASGIEAEAAAYYKSGKLELALDAYDRLIKAGGAGAGAYFERAVILSSLGRQDEAVRDYRAALSVNSHHYEANYNLGVVLLRMKDVYGAAAAFRAAADSTGGPRKANALYKMGAAYMKLGAGKHELAREAFEQAIRAQPDNIPARLKLAEMEPDTTEGYERAIEGFEKALRLKPNYAPIYFSMAAFQSSRGRVRQAITSYSNAVKFNPELLEARHRLGALLLSERRWSEAREQFELAVKKDPDDAKSRFYLGRAALGEKNFKAAMEEFQKAVSLSGGAYPEAHMNMGRAYSAMNDLPRAIQAYQDALKTRQDYHEAWYNLGLVHLRQKREEDAIQAFKAAVEHSPSFQNAWFNLGVAYARIGNEAESIKAYKKVIEISPEHKQARLNLAVRYARADQLPEAIRQYKEVLEQDESYSSAWLNLGIAYYKSGDNTAAAEALGRAIALEPHELKARLYMAKVKLAL
ncbi:MAG: tetratricopeptide repeat protein, partial [Deltaproteobacteria bacterium]|nr:tetratricopeptide repeat protein [Deltaproteobacteria bacterium]